MRVLLVDVQEPVAAPLTEALSQRHEVTVFSGDARDLETCRQSASCDVIVHAPRPSADALEAIDFAGRGTWNLLTTTTASRYVQLSTMRLFEGYDAGWHLDEQFPPLPTPEPAVLAPYLAEVASREILRTQHIKGIVLRLPEIVRGDGSRPAAEWLHVDDAVTAIVAAVENPWPKRPTARWCCANVVRGDAAGRYPLGAAASPPLSFVPQHLSEEPAANVQPPTIRPKPAAITDLPPVDRVLVLGAAGPLGSATSAEYRDRGYRLRLTDVGPLTELVSPQDGPKPIPTQPPHEERVVDITDPATVTAAAQDMQAIVNCTVIREHPVEAFRVNVLGAYNVMTAAAEHGIRRVVHTGPAMTLADHPAGYTDDTALASDLPPRPGDNLYFVTKYLALEICRIFAEHHAIACPTLLFITFLDPVKAPSWVPPSFSVTWQDAARAMAAAVAVEELPVPAPLVNVLADAPHDRYRSDAAREILDWTATDDLARYWLRRR
jgi:nucleoside-diphosphate-sugar epimerase